MYPVDGFCGMFGADPEGTGRTRPCEEPRLVRAIRRYKTVEAHATISSMIAIEDLCEPEWAAWYRMTPYERWEESARLWHHSLS